MQEGKGVAVPPGNIYRNSLQARFGLRAIDTNPFVRPSFERAGGRAAGYLWVEITKEPSFQWAPSCALGILYHFITF